jgi:hypothetical protein
MSISITLLTNFIVIFVLRVGERVHALLAEINITIISQFSWPAIQANIPNPRYTTLASIARPFMLLISLITYSWLYIISELIYINILQII